MADTTAYITVDDVIAYSGNTYTQAEQDRITELCNVVSDLLRQKAINVNKNLDTMISEGYVLDNVVKSVCCDIVLRAMMTPTTSSEAPMSTFSQSALGYTVSGTYLVPGGGIFIKNSELKLLGLLKQRYGVLEFYDPRYNC